MHHAHMVSNLVHGKKTIWVKVTYICSVHQSCFRVWKFVFFLPFHTSVLEPDFNLSLREDERMRDLYPSPSRQVPVVKYIKANYTN